MIRWLLVFHLLVSVCFAQDSKKGDSTNAETSDYPSRDESLFALDVVDKAFASYETILNGYKDENGKNLVERIEGKASFDKDADAVKTGRDLIAVLKADPSKIRSYSLVGVLTLADDVTFDASTTVTSAALTISKSGTNTESVTLLTAMATNMRSLRNASEELMHVTMRYIAADEKLMGQMYQLLEAIQQKPADAASPASHPATPSKISTNCNPPIETHINGEFDGWEDEKKIYKMDDGGIWQQSNYHYHYHYAYHPSVIIYATNSGICHVKVEGDDDAGADVIKLR